ncbi:glycosyltransferase [Mesonia aquimarina]|uniref:glycosyltransferase n=1 Tax=Mesonia aquimarina TaxID=1504967 RepID=UPI000EF56D9E|nr:glycosyltransferase [Mesonia aquimarina]
MISVLIPTYNYSIIDLVQELYQQIKETEVPFEIIIADDSSTNKKVSIKNKEFLSRITDCIYIENHKNIGRTATRNLLAKKAVFDNLLFLDADIMPRHKNFIHLFLKSSLEKNDLIFGGITYKKESFNPDCSLRWKFGNEREEKNVQQRNKNPYLSIISGCIFIKKDCFIEFNSFLDDFYGTDILFTYNLKINRINVLHINNPVYHLGLEHNKKFLRKSKKAIETLIHFEEKELLPNNYSSLQKAYLKLKKNGLTKIFKYIINPFNIKIEKILQTKTPPLFLFDLYRLYYLVKLKDY